MIVVVVAGASVYTVRRTRVISDRSPSPPPRHGGGEPVDERPDAFEKTQNENSTPPKVFFPPDKRFLRSLLEYGGAYITVYTYTYIMYYNNK